MNRQERKKREAYASFKNISKHRGSKKGYHKGCFGTQNYKQEKNS